MTPTITERATLDRERNRRVEQDLAFLCALGKEPVCQTMVWSAGGWSGYEISVHVDGEQVSRHAMEKRPEGWVRIVSEWHAGLEASE